MLELIFAFFSFLFYKLMRFLIGNLYTLYLILNKEKARQWRILSADNLKSPLVLPVLMTKAPRWNTHAIIGTLGPFSVKESVEIDLQPLFESSQSWILVFYSFPSYQTVTSLESNRIDCQKQWETVNLKTGKYTIGLRYYNWTGNVILPTIKVDSQILAEVEPIPKNINDFYNKLITFTNWFYLSLHYYIFVLLKYRKYFPEAFIKGEFLPVGATDTVFFYDCILSGEALKIEAKQDIVNNYDIYLTIYERSSLPVFWDKIDRESYITKPMARDGFYLFRLRCKGTSLNQALELNQDNFQFKRTSS